jgi:hypothetical protein
MRLSLLCGAIVLIVAAVLSAADAPLATIRGQWQAARVAAAAAVRKSQLLRQEGAALEQDLRGIRRAIESAAAPTPLRLLQQYRDKQAELAHWQRRFGAMASELSAARVRERTLLAQMEGVGTRKWADQENNKTLDRKQSDLDAILPPPTPLPDAGITSSPKSRSPREADGPSSSDLSDFTDSVPAPKRPPALSPKPPAPSIERP